MHSSVQFAKVTGELALTGVTTLHVSVVCILTMIKLLIINRDSSIVVFCRWFYFLSIISAFYAIIMSFIEALFRLRIVYFAACFVGGNLQCIVKLDCSTVLPLLLLTMVSVNNIYCRQIARFPFICSTHRGCLNWFKFVKISNHKFESQLTVINPCFVLW